MAAVTEHHDALDPVRESADNYVLVLALLVLYIFLGAFALTWWWVLPLQGLVLIVATVTSLRNSHVSRRLYGLAALATLVFLIDLALLGPGLTWSGDLSLAILVLLAPVAILRRIIAHRRITIRTIAGAVSVYLQIGLAFALLYRMLELAVPGSFNLDRIESGLTFVYLSFITLTTVGYGDITPATDPARVGTVLEALFGQVYLVVIVARLVSLYGQDMTLTSGQRSHLAEEVQEGRIDEESLPLPTSADGGEP